MIEVAVTVNGRPRRELVEPRLLLSDFIRHTLGLTGTHVGCEHGVCGACTVRLDGVAVRSCLLFAVQIDGAELDTVEGLAGGGELTPLQAAFREAHALQCGFCTPGILMAAADLLDRGREAEPRRDRGAPLRPSLPVHRLRADRRRDRRRGRGEVGVNLAVSLLAACERHPELEAFPGLPYGELLGRTRRIAGGLDLEPGDRLAVVLDNRLETALLYWAAQWAGAVFVPLSWRVSDEELDYCLADSGARVVIRDGDELPDGPEHPGALDRGEHEPSLLLYTSGTTGRPKGVPRSHRADRAGGLSQALEHGYGWADRTLGVMPLYHTMGIHSLLAMHLVGGCFVPQARWDPGQALALIEEQRITSLYLAPTLFHDLVHHPDLEPARPLVGAGARLRGRRDDLDARPPLPGRLPAERLCQSLRLHGGLHVHDRAGSEGASRAARAGPPSTPGSASSTGEIAVHLSSDEAFGGYWNRPEADAKAIRDGWYHTGDTGHLDEDGDLWIDGRVDDMIVSGGENVHPLEVEDVLAGHPGVREVAVVGAPGRPAGTAGRRRRRRDGDRGKSSTRTASRPRSPASSVRASTASSIRCREARLGRSSAGCSAIRR